MSTTDAKTPRVVLLADQILDDIRVRDLQPGDPYLTAADTARMLRVSTGAANRALQLLEQRQVLIRKQCKGTFIARVDPAQANTPLARVRLLVHQNYLRTEGILADGVIVGMQRELPGADVQFNFLSGNDDAESTRRLIAESLAGSQPEGFVMVRAPLPVQRLIHESGLPAVVMGTPYESVRGLSWLDRDHAADARLLTEYLLKRKHRRLLVLIRDRHLPGDRLWMDALAKTAGEAGLSADAVITRHLSADRLEIGAAVRTVLAESGPTPGIIARSEPLAEGAIAAAESLGLHLGRDIDVIVSSIYRRGGENPPVYPYVRSQVPPEEMGEHIGRLLARQARGRQVEAACEMIPVELCNEQTNSS